MKIEVLGSGCKKCNVLYQNVLQAVEENNIEAEVIKEEGYDKIIEYGITATPAMVLDGKVVSSGTVLNPQEVQKLLAK